MLVHTPQGRLLVDPRSHDISGAEGRIEYCVFPSYDAYVLLRRNGSWRIFDSRLKGRGRAWSAKTFYDATAELLKMQ